MRRELPASDSGSAEFGVSGRAQSDESDLAGDGAMAGDAVCIIYR
jgi:hypothetical protein